MRRRDVRSLVVTLYALLYCFYGMKLPAILYFSVPSLIGTTPVAIDLSMAVIPYLP